MKNSLNGSTGTIGVLLALALCSATPVAAAEMGDEQAIREARASFNRAIAERNVEAIVGFLAPDYHIVTSRNQQSHGGEAERQTWSGWFDEDPIARCQRDAGEIRVNTGWGQAQEQGEWTCWFTAAGEAAEAGGVYVAKWQQAVDGRWLLLAEVFTALRCRGHDAGCSAPAPGSQE